MTTFCIEGLAIWQCVTMFAAVGILKLLGPKIPKEDEKK